MKIFKNTCNIHEYIQIVKGNRKSPHNINAERVLLCPENDYIYCHLSLWASASNI